MRFHLVICAFVLFPVNAIRLAAQSANANINGLVSDSTNSVISDAEIVAANDVTGVQYTTKTNREGIYALPNLPPGPYRIQVSKIGFKTLIKNDVNLNIQDSLSINFTLFVGAFHEIVTVEGGAPLVNTENASVSTVVDRQFAENLPMNGRSFETLIELTPGIVAVPSNGDDNGQFSINGQRASSNYWMVDGVGANIGVSTFFSAGNGLGGTLGSFSALGGTNSLVSIDAMQEFRIQTSTFAPEFGRMPGGEISIVTRSGTNELHGTAFDYLRNDALDANNWFANNAGQPRPEERQNDFGGTFSGPIVSNRSFFFLSYEGLRLRLPQTALTEVPDVAARQSAVPAMKPYLNTFPLPNGPEVGIGTAQFNKSYSNPAMLDACSVRVDHKVSARWSLFGRYNYSPSSVASRGNGAALSTVSDSRITTQTGTAGATWSVSPAVTNDLRFNYSHVSARGSYLLDDFGGAEPLADPPYPRSYSNNNANFSLFIYSFGNGYFTEVGNLVATTQRQVNVVDGVSVQSGKHTLKLGIDFRRLSPEYAPSTYSQFVAFNDVASTESGSEASGQLSSARPVTLLFRNLGAYAQDTWRVGSRLSLTYGLRWDVDFSPSTLAGPSIPSVTGYGGLANFSQLAISSPGAPAFRTKYLNIAPRLGVAYQISQSQRRQTVFRGGAGVFYDLVSAETGNLVGALYPPFGAFTSNYFTGQFPFTAAQIAPLPISSVGTLAEFYGFNPHLQLPYTLQWNVAVEQSLGPNQTISVSHVGASGRRLLQTTYFLTPPPTYPTVSNFQAAAFVDNTASSGYDSLQAQLRRRLSRGVQALASYTWSHSIDDGSASSHAGGANVGSPGSESVNRGNSDFDIRNSLSAALTYDLPSPKANALMNTLLGGWSLESLVLARSAPPVNVTDSKFFELSGGVYSAIRPDAVPDRLFYLYGSQYPGGKALNPAAFTDPPSDPVTGTPLRQGNLGRNQLRGFGATQWDFAVHRDIPIRDSVKAQFRAEMFNLLNHPNFGPPASAFGRGGFGLSTQMLNQSLSNAGLGLGGLDPLYQIGGPRSIQLALKLKF